MKKKYIVVSLLSMILLFVGCSNVAEEENEETDIPNYIFGMNNFSSNNSSTGEKTIRIVQAINEGYYSGSAFNTRDFHQYYSESALLNNAIIAVESRTSEKVYSISASITVYVGYANGTNWKVGYRPIVEANAVTKTGRRVYYRGSAKTYYGAVTTDICY